MLPLEYRQSSRNGRIQKRQMQITKCFITYAKASLYLSPLC
jgi:hypothetical protein